MNRGQSLLGTSFAAGVLANARTSCGQLLRPFPQFTDISPTYSVGTSSFYHSFWDIPVGKGRRLGTNWSRPLDLAIGGWQVNGIATFSTGTPLGISASNTAGVFNL